MRRLAALTAVVALLAGCGGSDGGGDEKTDAAAKPAPTTPAVGGGGAPEPAPSATPPPAAAGGGPARKRYIARADRICRVARARLVPIRSQIQAASKVRDPDVVFKRYAALTGRAATVYSGALGQIRALSPPPADQAQIGRLNGLLGQIVDIMRQNSEAAAAQDAQRLQQLNQQVTAIATTYRAAAKTYGFRDCGQTAGALERRGNR
jgi:hypothetical protein